MILLNLVRIELLAERRTASLGELNFALFRPVEEIVGGGAHDDANIVYERAIVEDVFLFDRRPEGDILSVELTRRADWLLLHEGPVDRVGRFPREKAGRIAVVSVADRLIAFVRRAAGSLVFEGGEILRVVGRVGEFVEKDIVRMNSIEFAQPEVRSRPVNGVGTLEEAVFHRIVFLEAPGAIVREEFSSDLHDGSVPFASVFPWSVELHDDALAFRSMERNFHGVEPIEEIVVEKEFAFKSEPNGVVGAVRLDAHREFRERDERQR